MRVLKLHASLRYALSSVMFAGLWVLEARAHQQAKAALTQLEAERPAQDIDALIAENARLIELDQLRSKFVAEAAHELRAPITSLSLRLYLLENATPDRREKYVADFRAQLERLATLSEHLLALSRLDTFGTSEQFIRIDLNQIAEEVAISYRPMAEAAGLSLISEYTPNLPPVLGEPTQLARVGSNLVTNAIRYTTSGRVVVSTALDSVSKQACLTVKDTGPGIDPCDLPHLFDRFYRGKSSAHAGGSGLGRSIVKEIVDLHGGQITVESQPGEGTTFTVSFPLAQANAQAAD